MQIETADAGSKACLMQLRPLVEAETKWAMICQQMYRFVDSQFKTTKVHYLSHALPTDCLKTWITSLEGMSSKNVATELWSANQELQRRNKVATFEPAEVPCVEGKVLFAVASWREEVGHSFQVGNAQDLVNTYLNMGYNNALETFGVTLSLPHEW